jgi:hypothetical protein
LGETLTPECVHHWLLETPDDEVIRGRCKRCGACREYPASLDATDRRPNPEGPAAEGDEPQPDADQGAGRKPVGVTPW